MIRYPYDPANEENRIGDTYQCNNSDRTANICNVITRIRIVKLFIPGKLTGFFDFSLRFVKHIVKYTKKKNKMQLQNIKDFS